MIARVLKAALVAGFLAACVAATLQVFLTTPLILQAETYENTASSGLHSAHDHSAHEHDVSGDATETHGWQPGEGLSRAVFTSLATLVSGVGYALILAALILATGREIGVQAAAQWAIGGFLAVNLAPAVGLPPELPGMGGAHLTARQAWWILTVLGTGFGLYLVAAVRKPFAIGLGLLAIGLPHLIGAPHSVAVASEIPPVLASQFAVRSLAVAFAFWASLGVALGWCWERQEDSRKPGTSARAVQTAGRREAV